MSEENPVNGEDKGNGKLEQKTPEQFKEDRLKRYQEHPETFVELSEIVVMSIRNPKSQLGISLFMGNASRKEIDLSWSELNHFISKSLMNMDIESAMKKEAEKNLIHKPGGILNFARRRK